MASTARRLVPREGGDTEQQTAENLLRKKREGRVDRGLRSEVDKMRYEGGLRGGGSGWSVEKVCWVCLRCLLRASD